MRRIEEPYDGEQISKAEALRRVQKWAAGDSGKQWIDQEQLGWLLTDLKTAIFYLGHAIAPTKKREKDEQ